MGEVARRLDDHVESCDRRYSALTTLLKEHADDVNRKHAENLQNHLDIFKQFNEMRVRLYMIAGAAMVIAWLLTHANLGAILK